MILINKNKLRCPQCGGTMSAATTVGGTLSTDWVKCDRSNCETYIDCYIPLPFQAEVHKDSTRYVGIFGGYGSGKTKCGLKDDEKHMLSTPNGSTVVGSAVLRQVETTYEKDFKQDFPVDFIMHVNKTKKVYTLINGHELMINSFYEEGLLRSLTVTRFHIVEASEVDYPIFTQLQSRLRGLAGTVPEYDKEGNLIYDPETDSFKVKTDWRRGLVESNPDSGWIRTNYLLASSKIMIYGSEVAQEYFVQSPSEFISSHIIPTKANKYLPPNFYREQAVGKPAWWIRRYLQGSFDYAEGMVYPEVMRTFCKPFVIPRHWKRLIAMDYGIRDETAILFGAIDEANKILYIYHEIYINNVNYVEIANAYKDFTRNNDNVPIGSLLRPPVMDGRSINKRNDYNLETIGELFLQEGIYFDAAQMDLDTRILKTNTFIERGMLKIFSTCHNLCREIKDYKFPDRQLDARSKLTDNKPEDKNNHAVNALEFLVMEAPYDLGKTSLMAYHGSGKPIEVFMNKIAEQNSKVYNPFADTIADEYDSDSYGDYGSVFSGGF